MASRIGGLMARKHKTYVRGDARAQELRMTDADVAELRQRKADGESSAALAAEFTSRCGVSRQYIYMLLKGQRRRDDADSTPGAN